MTEAGDRPERAERAVNHLRDARLQQALTHAPDASLAPPGASRVAIKKAAAYAVNMRPEATIGSKELPQPWWRRWWQASGRSSRQRGPWNAAFATILLSSIITLIWYEQDVPDAVLEGNKSAVATAPSVSVAAAPSEPITAPTSTSTTTTTPASPAATPGPKLSARQAPQAAAPLEEARNLSKEKRGGGAVTASEGADVAMAPKTAPILVEESLQSAPAPAPALADAARVSPEIGLSEQKKAEMKTSVPRASAAAPAPAPAPAPASAPAPAIAAAAPPAQLSRAAPAGGRVAGEARGALTTSLLGWKSAELTYQGRVALLTRSQAQLWVDRVLAQVAADTGPNIEEPEGAPSLRLQLLDDNGNLALFDLWVAAFKWRPKGGAVVSGTLGVEQADALVREGAKLVPP